MIRGGGGIQYDVAEAPNGVLYSAADYYQINPNGYGISPLQNTSNPAQNGLQGGNAYGVGNPFGNTPVIWPNLNQDKYPIYNNGIGAPTTPRFSSIHTIVPGGCSPGASASSAK